MKWDDMDSRSKDALVAEHVMGLPTNAAFDDEKWTRHPGTAKWVPCPAYSTDIACAWEVVEKMREEGWLVRVQEKPDDIWWDEGNAIARAYCLLSWMKRETTEGARKAIHEHPRGMAETAPEAICKAALRAKGVDL